jgi:hypothetical protein
MLGQTSRHTQTHTPHTHTHTQTNLDTVSTSNIGILKRFQMIVNALLYVPNTVIRRDLQIQQLRKKSAATSLNIVLASANIQTT